MPHAGMEDSQVHQFTRAEKTLIRAHALIRERKQGIKIIKARIMPDGDVKAYCADGETYWIAPATELLAEAQ